MPPQVTRSSFRMRQIAVSQYGAVAVLALLVVGCSDPVDPGDYGASSPMSLGGNASVSSGTSTSGEVSTGGASTIATSGEAATSGGFGTTTGAAEPVSSNSTTGSVQGATTTPGSSSTTGTLDAATVTTSTTSGTSGFDAGTGGATATTTGDVVSTSVGGASTSDDTSSSTTSATPATFTQIATYLTGYCATSTACHGPGAREVELTGAGTYDTLMTLNVARCSNQAMVFPGDPEASAFYNVLTDNCSNFRMPPSCPSNHCTGEENIQMIASWILAGALDD